MTWITGTSIWDVELQAKTIDNSQRTWIRGLLEKHPSIDA